MRSEEVRPYLKKISRSDFAKAWLTFGIVFLTVLVGNEPIWRFILRHDVQYAAVYSTLFDLNSVLLAFMFSYFAFLKTSDNAFLKAAKRSTSYSVLSSRLLATMRTSLLFAVLTLVVIAMRPVVGATFEFQSFLFAAWVALVAVLVVKFVQLNSIFWLFIDVS